MSDDAARAGVRATSTAVLLRQARKGEDGARDALLRRYLPLLTAWARGRLPDHARRAVETDDLVQITLIRAIKSMSRFEPTREGAFLAYLRRALLNEIRDEMRRSRRLGELATSAAEPKGEPTPLEVNIGRETLEAYEAALMQLPEIDRESCMLRLEFGFSYPEIAGATGVPSSDAARMRVTRALVVLSEKLQEHR